MKTKLRGRQIRKTLKIPSNIRAASQKIPTDLTLRGEVEFKAAAGDVKEDKFFLTANTGIPMEVTGYPYPVIVDMKGHVFAKTVTPVIGDHDTKQRIGNTIDQVTVQAGETKTFHGRLLKGPTIAAMAVRSSESEFAKGIEADARKGFPFQVSIGSKIKDGYFIEEGETANVNGQDWKGPLIVASKSLSRELTITVLGADGDTSAVIAARAKQGVDDMNFSQWLKATLHLEEASLSGDTLTALKAQYQVWLKAQEGGHGGLEPLTSGKKKGKKKVLQASASDDSDDDDDDNDNGNDFSASLSKRRQLFAQDDNRIDTINATARRFEGLEKIKIGDKEMDLPTVKALAIREGWDNNRFELECRRSELPVPSGAPALHFKSGAWDSRAVEIGILRAAGVTESSVNAITGRKFGIQAMYDVKALEASDDPRYRLTGSFDELCDITIRASGNYAVARSGTDLTAQAHDVWSKLTGNGRNREIKASGFSTLILTNILENVANKAAVASFDAGETASWRDICGRRSLNDFKPAALYTLDLDGSFKKVATDGELKHITMRDTKRTIQADTYGAMITIDRKTRVNDDLGLVVQKASSLGSLSIIRIEESVYVLLLSNPGSFFASGNGNLITGGTSVMGITGILAAKQKFVDQTLYGKPIQVSPSILLTGTANSVDAGRFMKNTQLWVGGGNTDTGLILTDNPVAGTARVVTSGYLNNTGIKDQDGNAISGQTATQWYLLGNPNAPQGAAIVIGFLNGRETPYFDQAETQFNIPGGIQMRSYMDWGVAMHLTQMAVKSAGA